MIYSTTLLAATFTFLQYSCVGTGNIANACNKI